MELALVVRPRPICFAREQDRRNRRLGSGAPVCPRYRRGSRRAVSWRRRSGIMRPARAGAVGPERRRGVPGVRVRALRQPFPRLSFLQAHAESCVGYDPV